MEHSHNVFLHFPTLCNAHNLCLCLSLSLSISVSLIRSLSLSFLLVSFYSGRLTVSANRAASCRPSLTYHRWWFLQLSLGWQGRLRSPKHSRTHTQTIHIPHTLHTSPFEGAHSLQYTHTKAHTLFLSTPPPHTHITLQTPPTKHEECWWDRTSATCLSASAVMSGAYQFYK